METQFVTPLRQALATNLRRRSVLVRLAATGAAPLAAISGRTAAGKPAWRSPQPERRTVPTPEASPAAATPVAEDVEILWDTRGVPHIFAADAEGLFHGFGWAQAHAHGDLVLRLYAQARGRGAEFYGERMLPSDTAVRTMGLHTRGQTWYAAQSPAFRSYLDAFAAGINAYAGAHPTALSNEARAVLPVSGTDVLAHAARVIYLFLGIGSQVLPSGTTLGSNGWAIAPSRTERGNAMLLANPEVFWSEEQTFFEAQQTAPGLYDVYGTTFVGFPVLAIAFNDYLGWTHTVNQLRAGDLYQLTIADGGYRLDDEVLPFDTHTETIAVRQADGSLRDEALEVRRSVHGPVVEVDGATIAIRMAAVDDWSSAAGMIEQWWDMGRATNLTEFEDVLRRVQVPMFTVLYADRDGHILSLFNGQVPIRPAIEADWGGIVPGDTASTLWTGIHPYEDLPKVIDPPGGWVQNSNSAPWYTAYPMQLDPADFPPYLSTEDLWWRERRAIRMLEENPEISIDQLIALKYSTRMELADRILDDLIAAARASGDASAEQAAEVLAAWDREALPESTGALLFLAWVQAMRPTDGAASHFFAIPMDPEQPLTTPSGLKDPQQAIRALSVAANQVEALFGRLDVPWGEVGRLRWDDVDLPANGFLGDPFGVFRVLFFDSSTLPESGQVTMIGGDAYVAAIEFTTPVTARALNIPGNATQPGSPHLADQLEPSSQGQLRPVWRDRTEIEAHLTIHDRITLDKTGGHNLAQAKSPAAIDLRQPRCMTDERSPRS
jgi:acyl-homoserine-lactone acylase